MLTKFLQKFIFTLCSSADWFYSVYFYKINPFRSILHESIRKPDVFGCFQGKYKRNSAVIGLNIVKSFYYK